MAKKSPEDNMPSKEPCLRAQAIINGFIGTLNKHLFVSIVPNVTPVSGSNEKVYSWVLKFEHGVTGKSVGLDIVTLKYDLVSEEGVINKTALRETVQSVCLAEGWVSGLRK